MSKSMWNSSRFSTKLKKGDKVTYRDGDLLGLKWMDKRPIALLSTIHDDSFISKR